MTRREAKVLAKLLHNFYPIRNDHEVWARMRSEDGYQLNDTYTVHREEFGCTIWKRTDITVDPQWKGEPLVVFVPMWDEYAYNERNMRKLLRQLFWIYL